MAKLDVLDKKLLVLLDSQARSTMSELARKLQRGRDIVEYRVERLLEERIISRFQAMIDPAALGFVMFKAYFKLQKREGEIKSFCNALAKSANVSCFAETIGKWDVIANILAPSPHRFAEILDNLCAPFQESILELSFATVRRYHAFGRSYLAPNFKERSHFVTCAERDVVNIEELDVHILMALGGDARIPLSNLADSLSSHPITVKKHIERLEEKKIIVGYRAPMNRSSFGIEIYKVLIEQNTFVKSRVAPLITAAAKDPSIVACIEHLGPYHLELNIECPSLDDCEEILSKLLKSHRDVLMHQSIIRIKSETFNPFIAIKALNSARSPKNKALLDLAV